MSVSVARDVLQQVINLIRSHGLVGPHSHKAADGGLISTDGSIQHRNALQKPIDTDSQILNNNFNADLWRGQRYYVQSTAPSPKTVPINKGDLWFNSPTLSEWTGTQWASGAQGGGISVIPTHALLDGHYDNDTVAASPVYGDLITANPSNKWSKLSIGPTAGAFIQNTGTNPVWSTITFPTSLGSAQNVLYTFSPNLIGGLGIGSNGQVLTASGASPILAWQTFSAGSSHALLDGVIDNDTVAHTPVAGDLIYASGAGTWQSQAVGSTGQVQTVLSGRPAWQNPITATNGLAVAAGDNIIVQTGSYADLPTNVISLVLPVAGTYEIFYSLSGELFGTTNGQLYVEFYNVTDGADITSSQRLLIHAGVEADLINSMSIKTIITVNASKNIRVYAYRAGTGGGVYIDSSGHNISSAGYVRLA
jgi:hypothetical protein